MFNHVHNHKNTMINIVTKTVGMHFLVMLAYFTLGLVSNGAKFAVVILIPTQVTICLVISLILYIGAIFTKQDRNKILLHASSHLLSAIVVGIIGSSACSTILFPNFPH